MHSCHACICLNSACACEVVHGSWWCAWLIAHVLEARRVLGEARDTLEEIVVLAVSNAGLPNGICSVTNVTVVNGTVAPSCYSNNCAQYGWQSATDGSPTSFVHTPNVASGEYVQLDLGDIFTNLTHVNITARTGCCADRAANLTIYLSNTPAFGDANVCAAGVGATVDGATFKVPIPAQCTGRYLTVQRFSAAGGGTGLGINIAEITPYSGA